MRRFARLVQAVAGLLLAALVMLPAGALAHTGGGNQHVTISHYAYAPASLEVAAGTTVTWTNLDAVAHDVTVTRGPALFHSPMLSKGQSWSYTFTTAGPYTYICSVHPDMTASVTVTGAPGTASSAAAPAGAAGAAGAADEATATAAPASAGNASPSISPFLFVAGAACAVLVFALLMLADRPRA